MIAVLLFFSGLIFSFFGCLVIRKLLINYHIYDMPKGDRWHAKPIPKFGGIGIFTATILALLISFAFSKNWHEFPFGLISGVFIIFILGVIDDIKPMSPAAKLIGQILAASVVIYQGYTTLFFTPRLGYSVFAQLPNILLTFLWLVGITNAINLLDNMDGLAGGISLIASGFLSYLFWKNQDWILFSLSISLCGALVGFLIWNFPPARLFMGDSGSQFIGFTLALLAIARQPQASNIFAVMGVPTLLFLLPILDTTFVTITRLIRGESPVKGGRDHTSHRLIAFGLNERQVILVLYLIAIICGVSAMVLESLDYDLSLVLIPLIIIILLIFTTYLAGMKISEVGKTNQTAVLPGWMVEFAIRRNLLEVVFDFLMIAVAFYLAIFTRKFAVNLAGFENYLSTLPLVLICTYISFYISGIYRDLWRYLGIESIFNYGKASLFSAVLLGLTVKLFRPAADIPVSIFLFFGVFLFFGLIATRYSFRVLDAFSAQQRSEKFEKVLIYGKEKNVEFVIQYIQEHPEYGYNPIGIIIDDMYKVNKTIHGIKIISSIHDLTLIPDPASIHGVIIAPQSEEDHTISLLADYCKQNHWWIRRFTIHLEEIKT